MYFYSSTQWWHRYHRLGRQIEGAGGVTPLHGVHARLLLEIAARSGAESPAGRTPPSPEEKDCYRVAVQNLEDVLAYGARAFEEQLAATKAEALMDQDSRDYDSGDDRDGF